ncbi:MAG: amidohydrolase family protein [Planctomycetaceae bacterium]|nr:amidohydrolase family protein [Planctomycetaceae bacterium]
MKIIAFSDTFPKSGEYSVHAGEVFPIHSPMISDGFLNVSDTTVVSVTKKAAFETVFSYPGAILVPRFVNAHTHLEASELREPLPNGGMLTDWIKGLMAFRNSDRYHPQQALGIGSRELRESGTAAVGDIVLRPFFFGENDSLVQNVEETLHAFDSEMAGRLFLELIAWESRTSQELLVKAEAFLRCFYENSEKIPSRFSAGLSPHAPYTVCPQLLEGAVALSKKFTVPLAMHLAETEAERQFLQNHDGPFAEMLERLNGYQSEQVLSGKCPLDYLAALAESEHAVVIHGNFLDDGEIRFLAGHRDRMTVVFCPVAHRFFGHRRYPLRQMLDCGVRVALGTDSRASWQSAFSSNSGQEQGPLSMIEVVRVVQRDYPEVTRDELLAMATWHGAAALMMEDRFGTLKPGNPATFILLCLAPS